MEQNMWWGAAQGCFASRAGSIPFLDPSQSCLVCLSSVWSFWRNFEAIHDVRRRGDRGRGRFLFDGPVRRSLFVMQDHNRLMNSTDALE